MTELETKADRFRSLGREMRLQLLLDYSKKLPPLPEELLAARDAGLGRIEECQTPVYMWVGVEQGTVRIHADVPPESPTVRGFVSFLISVSSGKPVDEVARIPEDLMERMGLGEVLGVMRTQGLGAVLRRVKSEVARAAA